MNEFSASLIKWFSERPKWLQIAATRLLNKIELLDEDIIDLASLCQQEVNGQLTQVNNSFPGLVISQGVAGSLRLCSISDIVGVNALAPRKPLEFGEGNITVIYGYNGSGKSGYVRLLKHVCGARDLGTLHRNVYKSTSVMQKASITFEKDGVVMNHVWTGQGICDDLSCVDIFDTSFGRVFVNSEDEVSYEPPVLSFFSSLIEICEKVAGALDSEAHQHPSKKPNIPPEKKATAGGIWYDGINAKTPQQDIDKHCVYESVDETEIHDLQLRLAEQAPAEKAKQLRKQKQYIDALVNDAKKYLGQLSDDNCRRVIVAKKKWTFKMIAADTAAEKVFSGSHLEGVGSDTWKELWAAAQNYSISVAYKGVDYPNVSKGSRCVLCHQTLTSEAKNRLVSFEDFVKGELQRAVTEAAKEYETVLQSVENIPTSDSLEARVDATGIQNNGFTSSVIKFFSQLQARKDQLPGFDSEDVIPASPQEPKWIEEAIVQSKNLDELAAKYEEDAKSENRDQIKITLDSFLTKKWLSEHRLAINEEVNRLKLQNQIQKAKKTTNTKALSQKKGDLAKALITDAFVKRFNTELRVLSASQVKVELIKSKISKGRVLHKLQLRGGAKSSLNDILSEGENRIVSIAAFLADVTGNSSQAPFIFDDPISSLDQTYEEAVVQRLCALSSQRQVVIFTHRLSLLGLIQDYAKKVNIKPEVICIRHESWGTGEPGDLPINLKSPEKSLNKLINDDLSKARKLYEDEGSQEYERYAKGLCSDFRILLERMVESELIADVVQRYRRAINTLGKIDKLAKINEADCAYFDELMTKYSRYEHSQPQEAPVTLPDPNEFEMDFNALKQWQAEFKNRPIGLSVTL